MNALRIQGLVFSLGALLLALAATAIGPPGSRIELLVVAALIVVLGVPHGALDTIFARQLYGIRTLRDWLRFGVIYLLLATLVVGLWRLQSTLFLLGFLVISAAHFSGDPARGTPWPARVLYGGAVVILPAALHSVEITRLFSLLAGEDAAALLVPWLRLLSWPWLIGLFLAATHRAQTDWLTALELGSVGLLAVLASPLFSFVVFFCGMHSARHIIRTIDYSGRSSLGLILGAALLPMLGVLVASAAAWHFLGGTPLDARVIQLVFVGLAALTVPHMALVERVRLSGWVKGAAAIATVSTLLISNVSAAEEKSVGRVAAAFTAESALDTSKFQPRAGQILAATRLEFHRHGGLSGRSASLPRCRRQAGHSVLGGNSSRRLCRGSGRFHRSGGARIVNRPLSQSGGRFAC